MKQTKKLTRAQRTFLNKRGIKDTEGFRFIEETKDKFKYLDEKGNIIILDK